MAFGSTRTKARLPRQDGENGSGEKFVNPFMMIKQGQHKFRILPEVDSSGNAVMEPKTDPFGQPTDELTTVPESEVRWIEAWWSVMVDGNQQKRRFILDWRNPWKSALWKHIKENYEKGSEEWRSLKNRFGINVLDMTMVVLDANDNPVFAGLDGVYNIDQNGKKLETPVKPTAENPARPLNQVRILTSSTGDEGGKHFFQQLVDNFDGLEDNDGNAKAPHEVTMLLKTQGEAIKTTYHVRTGDFKKIPDDLLNLPRYDIAAWAKPWPDEAIQRLLEDEDFNVIVAEYGLKVYPELRTYEEVAEKPAAAVTKKAPTKKEEGRSRRRRRRFV